jgi:hypothetical protein
VARTYPACVWLNPVPEKEWDFTHSIKMVQQLMSGRMYPLTLDGLDHAPTAESFFSIRVLRLLTLS